MGKTWEEFEGSEYNKIMLFKILKGLIYSFKILVCQDKASR